MAVIAYTDALVEEEQELNILCLLYQIKMVRSKFCEQKPHNLNDYWNEWRFDTSFISYSFAKTREAWYLCCEEG